ncbi:aldo/keto reductase [Dipodascopsis uninucleata]
MTFTQNFTLNSDYKIPSIGLGTWLSKPNEVENAVKAALEIGYRHIDAAACYQNEPEVGRGIKASKVPREDIFVTSKLWNTAHRPSSVREALEQTLSDLQLDYLDLYLIHWPVAFVPGAKGDLFPKDPVTDEFLLDDTPIIDTWREMEALVAEGKIKSIGVSNFTIERLQKLLDESKIPPAVNQIEAHPYLQQPKLLEFCRQKNILITGYSPLGNNIYNIPRVVDDPLVVNIAKKLNKEPAQVLVSWAVQRGTAVVPKSVTPSRIKSNLEGFVLSDEDFDSICSLEKHQRMNFPIRWGIDVFGEVGQEAVTKEAQRQAAERVAARQN